MPSYQYFSLPQEGDNIRLLRLLPNEDEAAPLHGTLRNYSLQTLGTRTHLYEALSYVWGDSTKPLPKFIFIDTYQLPVTVKLHAALSRLRDHSFERIIWVDAVCIDQDNLEEREQQVKLMPKIYSKAHRIIVWLGEAADNSDEALEAIRIAAGKQSTNSSNDETIQQSILKLLQRPWFQRIWVRKQSLDNIRRSY
jgi:hypothetical protein